MKSVFPLVLGIAICVWMVYGATFGALRGIVHDPDHRPVPSAGITVRSSNSDLLLTAITNADGTFEVMALSVGEYDVTVTKSGFATTTQRALVTSGSAPVLHFQLTIGPQREQVTVSGAAAVSPEQMTPETIISRAEIETTPGADLSNSLKSIVNHVPGAWIVHDQLHVRGGHQVSWAIDGVPIPNTNIASNVGPQIDPKDVDYMEVQRGGYSAAYGDRTYGVFNVVPRTGFERNNEGELFTTLGTFHQTNDQLNYGNHTSKLAYFGSINGNRSGYGLETPGPEVLHDRAWGLGGLGTIIYNRDANNQLRFTTSTRSDNYQIPVDPDGLAAGKRDVERERDTLATFSWAHTLGPGVLLTASPFYHYNSAHFDGDPNESPVSATQHRASQYAGSQVALSAVSQRHNAIAGVYGFGQHDDEFVSIISSPAAAPVAQRKVSAGHLEALFLEDQYKALSWLTLTAGVRFTHFSGAASENAVAPRVGSSIRIPRLHWVFRGFWGKYYQAPPLSTVSGPLLDFAGTQGFGFIPLRGERDQEHQFGVAIPVRGWNIDVNNYHQRARNYFDHNAIGNSSVFFPLTIENARLYGWEVSVRSPRIAGRVSMYLSYAHARAEGAGAISGGLTDFSPPASGYFLLDHDQEHSLHGGFQARLPWRIDASGDIYYGSGFTGGTNGTPAHLPGHTTFDLALRKTLSDHVTISVTSLNLLNRRFLLDNSPTFGGTHYAEPRQVYVQLRYSFHL